jgi:alkylation response protein AidB-like acyl-CoA dehydrogenase
VVSGGLTEEERLLQATAREFATRELAPTAIERDEAERYDRSLFAKMGELGLTAAPLPEPVGGAGFSYLGWTLGGGAGRPTHMAVSLFVHILSATVRPGPPEQHARWPRRCPARARRLALTEPHAGVRPPSDAGRACRRLRLTDTGPTKV